MQSDVSSKVFKHAHQPVVLFKTVFALSRRLDSPHGLTFAEQVENQQVAGIEIGYHLRTRILSPCLHNPHRVIVGAFHGGHYSLACRVEVYLVAFAGLVEWIHGIILGFAVELFKFGIVEVGYFVVARVGGIDERRTYKSVPKARLGHVKSKLFVGVVGRHA